MASHLGGTWAQPHAQSTVADGPGSNLHPRGGQIRARAVGLRFFDARANPPGPNIPAASRQEGTFLSVLPSVIRTLMSSLLSAHCLDIFSPSFGVLSPLRSCHLISPLARICHRPCGHSGLHQQSSLRILRVPSSLSPHAHMSSPVSP